VSEWRILQGDALERLREMPDESVQCCVTSPPYWGLRDYGVDPSEWPAVIYSLPGGEVAVPEMACALGLEETPEQFVGHLILVMREIHRVLRVDGTLWLNLGDCYAGPRGGAQGKHGEMATRAAALNQVRERAAARLAPGLKPKDLVGIPWLAAFALRADGWYLRAENIWAKPNPMPESVTDRTTRSHEQLFQLNKSGDTLYWMHRDGRGTRDRPEPDYRWVHPETGDEAAEPRPKPWRRINLWRGRDYFYDADAIREPATFAGPNGAQKSPHSQGFGRRSPEEERERQDKQRGHGRRHAGFNDRWDAMSKDEQQALGRNKRSVWTIPTRPYPDAHFATFPPDLVEPCILAGSPPKSCGECGAPWHRLTEREDQGFDGSRYGERAVAATGGAGSGGTAKSTLGSSNGRMVGKQRTIGWAPTCEHDDDSGTPVVLDPFAGAATTGLVATQLGRSFIGIELNPEYVELGEGRIRRWEANPNGHLTGDPKPSERQLQIDSEAAV
jgi:DNA modification methylase